MVRGIKKYRNSNYYRSLDSLIDNMMLEEKSVPGAYNENQPIYDSNYQNYADSFTSIHEMDAQNDSYLFQTIEKEQKSSSQNMHQTPKESSTSLQEYVDQWMEELEDLEIPQNTKLEDVQKNIDNISNNTNVRQKDLDFTIGLKNLDDLKDIEVDHIKDYYLKTQFEKGIEQLARLIKPAERRKNIDPIKTVKKGIARSGGNLSRFYYKKSPTITTISTKPLDILVIGDVSGSMGKFVVLVLYFISVLEKIANVNSYIFSDTPTYVTPYMTKTTFRSQYENLREKATSWEYGTRLSLALKEVIKAKKYKSTTYVLLLTDGGISLEGNDWRNTLNQLSMLKKQVQSIFLISPNDELIEEGSELATNLQKPSGKADFLTPYAQKLFRYGVLHKYSNKQFICKNVNDVENIILALMGEALV